MDYRLTKHKIQLDIPITVFSTDIVDNGTIKLLKTIREQSETKWNCVLDLGCGYGPIALSLASDGLAERVDAVDRDFLAIIYTLRNATKNQLSINAFGSLSFDSVSFNQYDAIVSNIPAKVGNLAHRHMLLRSADFLSRNGSVWIVVVNSLEDDVDKILFEDGVCIQGKWNYSEHVVYQYTFSNPVSFPLEPYIREYTMLHLKGQEYPISTCYGLPEFDTLSWGSELLIEYCQSGVMGNIENVACWNPGQGFVPVALIKTYSTINRIELYSRDLLSLYATSNNLLQHSFRGSVTSKHTLDFSEVNESPDLLIGVIDEKEGIEINFTRFSSVYHQFSGVPIVLTCKINFGHRLHNMFKASKIKTKLRKKNGFALLII